MTIREEILKAGYSNKYVDEIVEEAYQQRIIPRKKFRDTKKGKKDKKIGISLMKVKSIN